MEVLFAFILIIGISANQPASECVAIQPQEAIAPSLVVSASGPQQEARFVESNIINSFDMKGVLEAASAIEPKWLVMAISYIKSPQQSIVEITDMIESWPEVKLRGVLPKAALSDFENLINMLKRIPMENLKASLAFIKASRLSAKQLAKLIIEHQQRYANL